MRWLWGSGASLERGEEMGQGRVQGLLGGREVGAGLGKEQASLRAQNRCSAPSPCPLSRRPVPPLSHNRSHPFCTSKVFTRLMSQAPPEALIQGMMLEAGVSGSASCRGPQHRTRPGGQSGRGPEESLPEGGRAALQLCGRFRVAVPKHRCQWLLCVVIVALSSERLPFHLFTHFCTSEEDEGTHAGCQHPLPGSCLEKSPRGGQAPIAATRQQGRVFCVGLC